MRHKVNYWINENKTKISTRNKNFGTKPPVCASWLFYFFLKDSCTKRTFEKLHLDKKGKELAKRTTELFVQPQSQYANFYAESNYYFHFSKDSPLKPGELYFDFQTERYSLSWTDIVIRKSPLVNEERTVGKESLSFEPQFFLPASLRKVIFLSIYHTCICSGTKTKSLILKFTNIAGLLSVTTNRDQDNSSDGQIKLLVRAHRTI